MLLNSVVRTELLSLVQQMFLPTLLPIRHISHIPTRSHIVSTVNAVLKSHISHIDIFSVIAWLCWFSSTVRVGHGESPQLSSQRSFVFHDKKKNVRSRNKITHRFGVVPVTTNVYRYPCKPRTQVRAQTRRLREWTHTQMFCDFHHVCGQVISRKPRAFVTHTEAPLKAAIDLEEWRSKYRTEDPSADAAFEFGVDSDQSKFKDQNHQYKSQMTQKKCWKWKKKMLMEKDVRETDEKGKRRGGRENIGGCFKHLASHV